MNRKPMTPADKIHANVRRKRRKGRKSCFRCKGEGLADKTNSFGEWIKVPCPDCTEGYR